MRKICANCKKDYREDAKYCRYCGAPMGEAEYTNIYPPCMYGPPPAEKTHKCEKCGYSWTNRSMTPEHYCPECGGNAPVIRSVSFLERLRKK